jgi:hypothetical protein
MSTFTLLYHFDQKNAFFLINILIFVFYMFLTWRIIFRKTVVYIDMLQYVLHASVLAVLYVEK